MVERPDEYGEEETAKRRDEVLKRMLHTPPQPKPSHPQSRVRNQKKAGADQQGHVPEKSGPAS